MDPPFPAYKGDEPYVFVSYSHGDSSDVYRELVWLNDLGLNIWFDEGIEAGSEWRDEIGKAIKHASLVLYYVSPASVQSENCRKEVSLADKQHVPIIAVHLKDTDLTDGLELTLSDRQAIFKHHVSAKEYQQKLSSSISSYLDRPTTQTVVGKQKNRSAIGLSVIVFLVLSIGVLLMTRQGNNAMPGQSISIAVLPFTNLSNDPQQEYFSDGITEDILNELARNTTITVRARASVFALKGKNIDLRSIGRLLNVTHVLEGSVRRAGERVRVSVQLSEVDGNRSIWSERYDHTLTDIFAVQDTISREILTALSAQLVEPASVRTFVSEEAYNAFLRGRDYLNRGELEEAIPWFKKAVSMNPANADAWANLARINGIMTYTRLPNSGVSRRERNQYLDRALAIDPTHSNALGIRALFTFVSDRDYQSSIDQLVRLVHLHPNSAEAHLYLSYVLGAVRRDELAVRASHRAAELSPLESGVLSSHVLRLLTNGSADKARQALDTYMERNPMVGFSSFASFEVALMEGDVAAMKAALNHPLQNRGPEYYSHAALIRYLEGDAVEVQEILKSSPGSSHWVQSRAALVAGDYDAALSHWRDGTMAGEPFAVVNMTKGPWRNTFPDFFAHVDFQQMLVDFGLDEESRSKITVPELPF